MGSKNTQSSLEKLTPALVNRRQRGRNALAEAIRGVSPGFSDSLSAVLKGGVCSVAMGTVVGSAMLGAPSSYGQDAGTIEEVTILGIRGSLKRALELKRDADGIVDGISAEEMGKFPDTNLAESLQRITGVSIDRSRGEGSKITVRGLGPQYNLVLFNGRQMPTQSGGNRSFDFANIASEGVSAIEVYKSSNAKIPTGGMGATVNISSTKPLRNPGLSASAGVKFVHDQSTETGNSVTPELSGIYSNTFADDRFGIALSASLQKRESGLNEAFVGGYDPAFGSDTEGIILPFDADQINRPTGNDIYGQPQNTGYSIQEFQRERINGQLTLQWQPIDSLTATLDYTYVELDLVRRYSDMSAWFGRSGQQTSYSDGPIASPLIFSESPSPSDFAMALGLDGEVNENNSVGFNLEWQPNGRFSLALDYHSSNAESRPGSRFGKSANLGLSSYNREVTTTYFNAGDIPVLQMEFDPSFNLNGEDLDINKIQVAGSVFSNSFNRMEIEQATLSGDFEINDISSIDFGVQISKVDNRALSSVVQRNTWGRSPVGTLPDFTSEIADVLTPASIAGRFDELSGGNDPRLHTDYFTASFETLIERVEELIAADPNGLEKWSPDALTTGLGDCGTGFCAESENWSGRTITVEDTESIYLQYNLALYTELPIDLHIGVRYEETEVESPASTPKIVAIAFAGVAEFALQADEDASGNQINIESTESGSYSNVLPNFDIAIDIFDDVKTRFSYSKSISRPGFDAIKGGINPAFNATVDGGTASGGSPSLKPLESTNFDLSVEWYFTDESYMSVGYFKKEVDNFIGSTTLRDVPLYAGVTTPVNGAFWNDALATGGTAGTGCGPTEFGCIQNFIAGKYGSDPSVTPGVENPASSGKFPDAIIVGRPGVDPALEFRVSQPANLNKVDINGWEVAIQHAFGESGFGGIINATVVSANVGYDNFSIDDQFVIDGLSDSANVIAYYEKDGVQARIAYNWRDEFLLGAGQGTQVGSPDPSNREAYAQWDFSASYEVDEHLTLFAEGINVTNETTRDYGRSKLQVLRASQGGARYNFGLRYKL